MIKRRWLSLILAAAMLSTLFMGVTLVFAEQETNAASEPAAADCVYDITDAYYDDGGLLHVDLTYNGIEAEPAAKLLIGVYDNNEKIMLDSLIYDIVGTEVQGLDFAQPENGLVKLYVWKDSDSIEPLSDVKIVSSKPIILTQASSGIACEYDTIRDAVAMAAELNPQSNEERVVISVMPGLYREQVVVKTPYVTIKKDDRAAYHNVEATYGETSTNKTGTYLPDPEKEVIITWYYGIGYTYKSAGSDGFYDPNLTDGNNEVTKWGATVYVTSSANEFIADDIVFENSFNRYVTDEEIEDGVTATVSGGKPARTPDADVASNTYNERSAAIYTDGDRSQFLNCKFLSSQDTFGANRRLYAKNCYIEGRTDYICGVATAVFDECRLMFYGYSNNTNSGTITAMQAPFVNNYGVLFNNCYIGNTKSKTVNGSLGRPWRQEAQVTYLNCIYQNNTNLISATGWGSMSSATPELAQFREYGTKYENGNAVNLSARVKGTVMNEWTMLEYNIYNYTKGNDGWDPANVKSIYDGVNDVADTTVFEIPSGDSNSVDLPEAPVGYEFKWESNSEFVTVNSDGTQAAVIRPAAGEAPIESTVVLYVRDSNNKEIGTKKVIPVSISATTDTENVFKTTGTVSMVGAAPSSDLGITVKFYKDSALIKTASATIKEGTTSAEYTAENIPVGTYDVVVDTTDTNYKVAVPENGKTTITGAIGETQTINAVIGGLVARSFDVTGDPASIGSGVTVTNNNGEYTVSTASSTTGGAYWNLSSLADNINGTDTLTISYTIELESGKYKADVNSINIDILAGKPGVFSTSANNKRILRTNAARWDQLNMLDIEQASISGSSTDEHQWLNCSGTKFSGNGYLPQNVQVNVDFKNGAVSAQAQVEGADSWKTWDFAGFPTTANIDRDNLSLAVYPSNSGATTFTIKNISVSYTEFE